MIILFTAISDHLSYQGVTDVMVYNVLVNQCDEDPGFYDSFWKGPNQLVHGYFVLDLGVKILIEKVTLKNSYSGNDNDR